MWRMGKSSTSSPAAFASRMRWRTSSSEGVSTGWGRMTTERTVGMPQDTSYGTRTHVEEEISFSREIFRNHPNWPVIDVTNKAIEETASDILRLYKERHNAESL